ncbi:sugar ABC transporter permease [Ornithinicoccus hortensis]|uniref:Carbohydrate ABC transporter membrane protein 2 (CUT1 family) n=1 Tax=Ornithinicoccus hortensis TaxID=82346 RepID=A0A542YP29_9MICO|nr:sugar ABC transporter permease [Ornithinicoccus hortensis]TQL49856.1 carbohydrate ABC transporter membrane protein 2 (CUT1 family) [Ornithinicoccus hortensis]
MSTTPTDLTALEAATGDDPGQRAATGNRWGGVWWRHALALLALAFALFPILFIVSSAFNNAGTLSTSGLMPTVIGLDNFHDLFNDPARPYWNWYRNSVVICVVATLCTLFLGASAAYAFSRLRWQGRRAGLLFILLMQMFPAVLAFGALYITFANIGQVLPALGLNTLLGLILVYLGGAMGSNIWLLKGYFDTVPKELDEAAYIDGASHARIFFTVTLRLVTPILATVAMLAFVGLWGEFLLASIFLTDVDQQTLAVGLWQTRNADQNAYFGQFVAGAVLASIPVVLVYLGLQRQLIGGLTQGSVK